MPATTTLQHTEGWNVNPPSSLTQQHVDGWNLSPPPTVSLTTQTTGEYVGGAYQSPGSQTVGGQQAMSARSTEQVKSGDGLANWHTEGWNV